MNKYENWEILESSAERLILATHYRSDTAKVDIIILERTAACSDTCRYKQSLIDTKALLANKEIRYELYRRRGVDPKTFRDMDAKYAENEKWLAAFSAMEFVDDYTVWNTEKAVQHIRANYYKRPIAWGVNPDDVCGKIRDTIAEMLPTLYPAATVEYTDVGLAVTINGELYSITTEHQGKDVESTLDANKLVVYKLTEAMYRYDKDELSVDVDECTGMICVNRCNRHMSDTIWPDIVSVDDVDKKALIRELDKLGVGHCGL